MRHRIEDLEALVPFLLREITRGADVQLAAEAMRQLGKLPWPVNVAQLRQVPLRKHAYLSSNSDENASETRVLMGSAHSFDMASAIPHMAPYGLRAHVP